ncbi:MAG: NAD-dependent epimerase/dehydratase family protein [Thiohalomonadaceae bacterium]
MIANETYGIAENFRPGEYARAERVIAELERLGVRRVRTAMHRQDFATPHGRAWFEWLLAALAGRAELLVCLSCSPGAEAAPEPETYAAFVDEVLVGFSPYIAAVELTGAPDGGARDPRLDPLGTAFSDVLAQLIGRVRERGKRVLIGAGPDLHGGWLELLGARGLLREIDAIGLQARSVAADLGGHFWPRQTDRVRSLLTRHGSTADLWLTEAGFAGAEHDDRGRMSAFLEALDAPAQRVYWAGIHAAGREHDDAGSAGALVDANGRSRLLGRLLTGGGPAAVRELAFAAAPGVRRNGRGVHLITGGAGFIGTNLAARLLAEGKRVRLLDNLQRAGTETNLKWLAEQYGERLEFVLADMRDEDVVAEATLDAEAVFHFAAQVAVTTSLETPVHDFEVNARGTLNLLEALRQHPAPPPLIFTSTNKVYGGLEGVDFRLDGARYAPADPLLARQGVDESRPLSFCSPYGCSKGAADQYVVDYARTFGLPAVVLRMSCIYGPHQFGNEDQGWVAHFMRQVASGEPITIYGDGRQVRDVLFVDDLLETFGAVLHHINALKGHAFNVGGGPQNTLSLLELIDRLAEIADCVPEVRFEGWRASDQRWYVSDTGRFTQATGWRPEVNVADGLQRLWRWITGEHLAPAAVRQPPAQEGRRAQ